MDHHDHKAHLSMRVSWDIFCRVVDNFGDIGVSWRLAKQLAAEYDYDVRLWVDDLDVFCRLYPQINPELAAQKLRGVAILRWPLAERTSAADVVIEAFACQLPTAYIDAMARRSRPSLWLNLEYLSAENWVAGCHGLPSLQAGGLQKYFYFPGFTPQTGGLLREENLLSRRQRFQQDPQQKRGFLQHLGVVAEPDVLLISLFAYENTGLASWLDALATGSKATHILVPEGRITGNLQAWLKVSELAVDAVQVRGALTVQVLPFLSQDEYDRLLWSCDFNAVRGEDSFVRALWAGRPLLWQLYKQPENVHLDKLEAMLALYTKGMTASAKAALIAQWRTWNRDEDMQAAWQSILRAWPELLEHAENWSEEQALSTNLAAGLAQFYRNWL